jgi:hypothetical protein
MKTTILYSLVLLTMLGIGLSCKKEVEPITPTLNLANCRISKETYSTIYITGDKNDPQEVIADGEKFIVYGWKETKYIYDNTGRLTQKYVQVLKGIKGKSIETYKYEKNRLTIHIVNQNSGQPDQESDDIITLNEQGFNANYFYDSEGHQLASKGQPTRSGAEWVGGNRIKSWYGGSTEEGTSISAFQYDLTKPALPNPYPYRGKPSVNLQIQYQAQAENSFIFTNGPQNPLYQINSYYEFDKYGRVSRLIMRDYLFPKSGWPYGTNPGRIGVIDYEYECP